MKILNKGTPLVLVFLFLFFGVSYGGNSTEVHYKKGIEYATEGKFVQARVELKEALKVNPGDNVYKSALSFVEDTVASRVKKEAALHFFKGVQYTNNGSWDEAVSEFSKAIVIDPQYAVIYINRGAAYDDKGRYSLAIAEYTKAIELKNDFTDAYYNRGRSYASQGQNDLAITDFTKALGTDSEMDPRENAEIYANRALSYGSTGKYDRAISDFSKALKIYPDIDVYVYYFRGKAYDEKGQTNMAITDYSKVIEIAPAYVDAYYSRAKNYNKTGRYDKAISDYTKAIEINPEFILAYLHRGLIFMTQMDEKQKACRDFKKACELGECRVYEKSKSKGFCG